MSALAGHFAVHLRELRQRVTRAFLAIVLSTVVAYSFVEELVQFLMRPLIKSHPELSQLVYTNLTEAFVAYLKVSLLIGLIAALPFCFYQLWCFVTPGLHRHEKRLAQTILFWSSSLLFGGALFAYLVILPELLAFLISYAGEWLTPLLRLDAYLTFVARTCLAFGLAFELPFLMVMATRADLVAPDYFAKKRKYAWLVIFGLAFLLTVGDILSALLLSLPLGALFESGILLARIFKRRAPQSPAPQDAP